MYQIHHTISLLENFKNSMMTQIQNDEVLNAVEATNDSWKVKKRKRIFLTVCGAKVFTCI